MLSTVAVGSTYTVYQQEIVQVLMESDKTDPNINDNTGQTPLYLAVILNHFKTASLIVKHSKCRPNIPNKDGKTPLQCAIASGKLNIVVALISSGKCSQEYNISSTLLHRAVDSNVPQVLSALLRYLDNDCSINEKDENGETVLHKACRGGNLECIRILIGDERCDPNIQLSDGSTALHVTESSHYHTVYHHEVVQCLLKSTKIEPNLKDNSGQTPLHIAVVRKHKKSASLLLKRSTHKSNLQDNDGNTALHLGVGSLWAVELFLSHASIALNIQNSAGNTPLHEAVIREASCDVVKALVLHKSCDPNIPNKAGMTPLQCAIASERSFNVVKALISSGKCNQEHNIINSTLLHRVVDSNIPQLLSAFQDNDCSINEKGDNGETVLHKACRGMKLEYIRALIGDERCDPNIQLSDGSTALHVAVSRHYYTVYQHEVVQCILKSTKIDPNLKDDSGQTPLHIAVVREHFEIASLLFKHSTCKPNVQDNDGNTALHLSVGLLYAVKLFLSHTSIDLNIQNRAGNTPLHEAVIRRASSSVVKALVLHKSCDPNVVNKAGTTPLQGAITSGNLDYVEAIISSGKCSHEHKIMSCTHVLHRVVDSNKPQLLSALLKYPDNDCSINEKDDNGETVLHKACRCMKLEYIRVLIGDERCDPNIQFSDGSTALHVAVSRHYYTVYQHEVVQCLLQSTKIDPNLKDNSGQTPLHIAVARKHFEIASMLFKHSTHKPIEGSREKMWIFNKAVLYDHPVLVKKCIEVGCSVNNANTIGEDTPLHIVCRKGYKEFCLGTIAVQGDQCTCSEPFREYTYSHCLFEFE